MKHFRLRQKEGVLAIVILYCAVIYMGFMVAANQVKLKELNEQYQITIKQRDELSQQLNEIKVNQEKELEALNKAKKLAEEQKKAIEEHKEAVSKAKNMYISYNTDLCESNVKLNAHDMDVIIDKWNSHIKNGTRFKGKGAAFIEASKLTGMNPICILAIACLESGYGNSYIAMTKHNYYGINAVDSSPTSSSSTMGSNTSEGIINGAVWIKKNFYDNGYRTLGEMSKGGYSSNSKWATDIISIANTSRSFLD